jgi:glycosyltransferase involved in cell wall biosynthesis
VVAYRLHETAVSAGEAAVYVEPGDVEGYARTIAELLDDAPRRAEMGRIGRRRIEDSLSWAHSAPKYVGVFRSLVATRPPAGR